LVTIESDYAPVRQILTCERHIWSRVTHNSMCVTVRHIWAQREVDLITYEAHLIMFQVDLVMCQADLDIYEADLVSFETDFDTCEVDLVMYETDLNICGTGYVIRKCKTPKTMKSLLRRENMKSLLITSYLRCARISAGSPGVVSV